MIKQIGWLFRPLLISRFKSVYVCNWWGSCFVSPLRHITPTQDDLPRSWSGAPFLFPVYLSPNAFLPHVRRGFGLRTWSVCRLIVSNCPFSLHVYGIQIYLARKALMISINNKDELQTLLHRSKRLFMHSLGVAAHDLEARDTSGISSSKA